MAIMLIAVEAAEELPAPQKALVCPEVVETPAILILTAKAAKAEFARPSRLHLFILSKRLTQIQNTPEAESAFMKMVD